MYTARKRRCRSDVASTTTTPARPNRRTGSPSTLLASRDSNSSRTARQNTSNGARGATADSVFRPSSESIIFSTPSAYFAARSRRNARCSSHVASPAWPVSAAWKSAAKRRNSAMRSASAASHSNRSSFERSVFSAANRRRRDCHCSMPPTTPASRVYVSHCDGRNRPYLSAVSRGSRVSVRNSITACRENAGSAARSSSANNRVPSGCADSSRPSCRYVAMPASRKISSTSARYGSRFRYTTAISWKRMPSFAHARHARADSHTSRTVSGALTSATFGAATGSSTSRNSAPATRSIGVGPAALPPSVRSVAPDAISRSRSAACASSASSPDRAKNTDTGRSAAMRSMSRDCSSEGAHSPYTSSGPSNSAISAAAYRSAGPTRFAISRRCR